MSELLSQEQLDQLLASGGFSNDSGDSGSASADALPDSGTGALKKAFEVFARSVSSVLATVLGKKVDAGVESCGRADLGSLGKTLGADILCIDVPFKNGLTGNVFLCLKKSDVALLADLMMMGDGNAPFAEEHKDAIGELTNQITSSFALEISGDMGSQVSVSPSSIAGDSLSAIPGTPDSLGMITIALTIEGRPGTTFGVLVPQALIDQIAAKSSDISSGGGLELNESDFSQGGHFDAGGPAPHTPSISTISAHQKENIEMLLDVDLDVTIELGRSTLSIKRILELAPGSIVELDRMAGEPVDLRVNNKVVAKGEVVVIDESFGIRILSLISPEERIKSLA